MRTPLRTLGLLALAAAFASPALAQHTFRPFPVGQDYEFQVDQKMYSPNSTHYLTFQSDGNLAVYTDAGELVWNLNDKADYRRNTRAVMQADGNLAVYARDRLVWSTGLDPRDAVLTLTDEGLLLVGAPESSPDSGRIYWQSGTVFPAGNGFEFLPDHSYYNESMSHALRFQSDGNLVVYTVDGTPVWGLNDKADYRRNTRAVMQADGNLVTYNPAEPTWATMTNGNSGATLDLTGDGTLVIRSASGTELWRSSPSQRSRR